MARLDPQIAAHLEWIGFVRPTGLVVSAPALVKAGALLNRRDAEGQQLLRECVEERGRGRDAAGAVTEPEPRPPDFHAFASSVLGWSFSPSGYAGTDEAPNRDQHHRPGGYALDGAAVDLQQRRRDLRGTAACEVLLAFATEQQLEQFEAKLARLAGRSARGGSPRCCA